MKKRPRQYGTGSLYQRGRNWFVRFRHEGKRISVKIVDPETGKPPETKSQAALLSSSHISEFLNDKNRFLKAQKRKGINLEQAVNDCISSVKDELSSQWYYVFKKYLENRVVPFFGGNTLIADIDSVWIGEFRDSLKKSGISNKTVNKVLGVLSKLLKHCARIGVIKTIPYISRLPIQEKEFGRRLSIEEIDKLFEAAEREGYHAVLFLGFGRYCGARHAEALRVQWEWIDWDGKFIRLDRQKNETDMPLPLTGPMLELLNKVPKSERHGTIIQKNGRSYKSAREMWDRIKDKAKIDSSIRYHDLRHTFSCEVFDRYGFQGKELTRHSGTEAYRKYLHFNREKLIKEASDDLFGDS